MSSTWMKNSTVFMAGSNGRSRAGGPRRTAAINSGHGIRSRVVRRTRSVYPASGAQTSPGPLSGRRSRTTR